MKKQPSQKELVLRHLVRYGSITDTVAREKYGIARLAARIHELRSGECPFLYSMAVGFKTRLGRKGTFAKYGMVKSDREFHREILKGAK